jgi:hypothetical protein
MAERAMNSIDWIIAVLLETYYAGRTECHIRRLSVSGILLDFLSEYPTAFVLQDLNRFLTAEGFDWHDIDTDALQHWISALTLADLLTPTTYQRLAVVALVEPHDDQLPTRCQFEGTTWTLGIQRRTCGPAQWWTLADCLVSWLETGRAPRIIRALKFTARGMQSGLRTIVLAGDDRFRIDPTRDDIVRRSVELKELTKRAAESATDPELFDATAKGLKIMVNSIYGSAVEINVNELSKPDDMILHRPDESHDLLNMSRVEEPGNFFNPLLATLITAGGRLLLALAMRLLADIGGTYAMCDTDSVFAAATIDGDPDPHAPDLPYVSVETLLLRVVQPFEALNPYDRAVIPGSILQVKPVNVDPETKQHRVVYCYSIASKRYCLYSLDQRGSPHICISKEGKHRSEHGLGHVLPPLGIEDDTDWITATWEHLLALEHGQNPSEPIWFDQPTFGQITITNPHDDRLFDTFNANRPYPKRIRPFGFALTAYRNSNERQQHPNDGLLITAYTRHLPTAMTAQWMLRNAPERGTFAICTEHSAFVIPETLGVQTFRDLTSEYAQHPERKSAGPDEQPCQPWTRGMMQPRNIEATTVERIGKEANRYLADGDPITQPGERTVEYHNAPKCKWCGRSLVGRQRDWCSDTCRKQRSRRPES